jgi:small-conductance mechanosensitive channel
MDNLIAELERLSRQVMGRLDELDAEALLQFVEDREQLIQQLKALGIDAVQQEKYRERVRKLLEADLVIRGKLFELKDEASQGLVKLSRAKKQINAYEKHYEIGSVYVDKRK